MTPTDERRKFIENEIRNINLINKVVNEVMPKASLSEKSEMVSRIYGNWYNSDIASDLEVLKYG